MYATNPIHSHVSPGDYLCGMQANVCPAPRMKQLLAYMFTWNNRYQPDLQSFRRQNPTRENYMGFVEDICSVVHKHHQVGGLSASVLINHMTLRKEKQDSTA